MTARAALPARAHPAAPPFLIEHGTADTAAPFDQGRRLHAALVAAGAHSTLVPHAGAEHFFDGLADAAIVEVFDRAMRFAAECVSDRGQRPRR